MELFIDKKPFLPIILFFLISTGLKAQLANRDSVFYHHAINQAALDYQNMMGDNSRIFNGVRYAGYPYKFTSGHQFFNSTSVFEGTVVYDGILYQDLKLQYDEIFDEVILHSNSRWIQLSADRISNFTLKDFQFMRIVKDSISKSPISKEGFYQVHYKGKVSVLSKEVKEVVEELTPDQGVLHRVISRQDILIKKGNDYLPINRKKDLMEIYKDKKKEIRGYVKDNRLNFREEKERFIIKVTAYYDQITR